MFFKTFRNHPARQQYVIDDRLQYRLSLHIGGVIVLALALAALNLNVLCELSSQCDRNMVVALLMEAGAVTGSGVLGIVYAVVLIGISIGALLFLCLLIGHRIAGPAYKISQFLMQYDAPDEPRVVLRKGDHLGDLAEVAGHVARSHAQYQKRILSGLANVREAVEAGADNQSALDACNRLEHTIKQPAFAGYVADETP